MDWKRVLAKLSKPNIGEHKFDGTVRQKLGVGKWEGKKDILMFQKVAKTGNIGEKKSSGRLYRLPSNSFVPLIQFFFVSR